MAIRNFWLGARIDGRETEVAGGPRSKDGGLVFELFQRDHGQKRKVLTVYCIADGDGLVTEGYSNGKLCFSFETER